MTGPIARLFDNPLKARVAPFVIFLLLTMGQGQFGPESHFWFYLAKTLVGAWLVWMMIPRVSEVRWAASWEAFVVGIAVFVGWVGVHPFTPWFGGEPEITWNPFTVFGEGTALAWMFIVTRVLGSTLVVPYLEEAFYRSFLYRWVEDQDFLRIPIGRFILRSFVITALLFGFAHGGHWLAGVLCGAAYQWLVIRKNRLGDAMTAHAITNLLLGVWIVWKGEWWFW